MLSGKILSNNTCNLQSNQSFEDGELIQPPPPRPKSAIPFDQAGRAFNDIPKYSNKPGQQSYIVSQFYTFIS